MRLSRTATYALQATWRLATEKSSEPAPCSRIAEEGHMPERFLLQVLRRLVTAGILESVRGSEGGYRLHKSPEDITVLEIIEAVEGRIDGADPPDGMIETEPFERLRRALAEISEQTRQQLNSIRLSHLTLPAAPSEPKGTADPPQA